MIDKWGIEEPGEHTDTLISRLGTQYEREQLRRARRNLVRDVVIYCFACVGLMAAVGLAAGAL